MERERVEVLCSFSAPINKVVSYFSNVDIRSISEVVNILTNYLIIGCFACYIVCNRLHKIKVENKDGNDS
jgi:hypothetical protein